MGQQPLGGWHAFHQVDTYSFKFSSGTTAFSVLAFGKKAATTADKDAVATITEMENASVKADTEEDSSFVEKNYADNFSGGSSSGNWETNRFWRT